MPQQREDEVHVHTSFMDLWTTPLFYNCPFKKEPGALRFYDQSCCYISTIAHHRTDFILLPSTHFWACSHSFLLCPVSIASSSTRCVISLELNISSLPWAISRRSNTPKVQKRSWQRAGCILVSPRTMYLALRSVAILILQSSSQQVDWSSSDAASAHPTAFCPSSSPRSSATRRATLSAAKRRGWVTTSWWQRQQRQRSGGKRPLVG